MFSENGRGTPEDLIFFYHHLDVGGKILRVDEDLLMYRYHTVKGFPRFSTFPCYKRNDILLMDPYRVLARRDVLYPRRDDLECKIGASPEQSVVVLAIIHDLECGKAGSKILPKLER